MKIVVLVNLMCASSITEKINRENSLTGQMFLKIVNETNLKVNNLIEFYGSVAFKQRTIYLVKNSHFINR